MTRPLCVCVILVLLVLLASSVSCSGKPKSRSTVEDFLNTCLDGHNHKRRPGPESTMFQQCAPWKKRSCCTAQVSQNLHMDDTWLNFDWNHCTTLSSKCRQHFLQDLCFYECSPNVGPWLVPVKMRIRNERFLNVPLCRSECEEWWSDCRHDFTCLADWSKGFNWTTGINKCPTNSPCRKFKEVFNNSTNFCENIWGGSFKVVQDGEQCMYLWFDPDGVNPNDEIARRQAERLVGSGEMLQQVSLVILSALGVVWSFV